MHASARSQGQGNEAANLYILIAGQVQMTQITPKGYQVLRVAGPGETLGVIAAVDSARYRRPFQTGGCSRQTPRQRWRGFEEHPVGP